MKYIHFNCLKYWIEQNIIILEDNYEFFQRYKYKEPICELCKTKFPEIVNYKGKELDFLDAKGEFHNYAVFEILFNENKEYKILFLLCLDKKNQLIKVGRALDNHIILSDNSISRYHFGFIAISNRLFIEDIASKFGTLILIQVPNIQLTENLNLYLQIGNNFIKCNLYNPSLNSLFSCCGIDNKDKKFDFYYEQNREIGIKSNIYLNMNIILFFL